MHPVLIHLDTSTAPGLCQQELSPMLCWGILVGYHRPRLLQHPRRRAWCILCFSSPEQKEPVPSPVVLLWVLAGARRCN